MILRCQRSLSMSGCANNLIPILDDSQRQSSTQAITPAAEHFVNPLLIRNCGNNFPQFAKARLYIEVVWPHKDFTYRLNISVLTEESRWFADSLKQPVQETNIAAAEKIKQESGCYYKFELWNAKEDTWILQRVVSSPT